ncbi:hypothetical protein Taro_028130, partial [Colocasia esculenta]|nr:hypothetical protein [Colocasia esculenta]
MLHSTADRLPLHKLEMQCLVKFVVFLHRWAQCRPSTADEDTWIILLAMYWHWKQRNVTRFNNA